MAYSAARDDAPALRVVARTSPDLSNERTMLLKALSIGGATATALLTPTFLDSITRGAAEGEERTRTIEVERLMETVDFVFVMNGEEIPADEFGDMDSTYEDSLSVTLHDVIAGAQDGRATRFTRTYRALSGSSMMESSMMGDESLESDLGSELEGEDVVFAWDAEEEDYVASFPEDSDADEALLELLVGDLELAELLPEGDVAVGDEWRIDLELIELIQGLGSDVSLVPEGDDFEFEEFDDFEEPDMDDIEPEYDGTFTGTLASVEERVATIELEFEIDVTVDMSAALEPMEMEDEYGDVGFVITPTESIVESSVEGTGTLTWDLEKGRLISLEFNADLVETSLDSMEMEVMGDTFEQTQEMTEEGTLSVRYTIE